MVILDISQSLLHLNGEHRVGDITGTSNSVETPKISVDKIKAKLFRENNYLYKELHHSKKVLKTE